MHWIGRTLKTFGKHIRTTLIAGILIMIPVAVTVLILRFIFEFFDGLLEPLLDQFIDYQIGMGIAGLAIIIYLVGLVTTHFLGKRLINLGNNMVDRIPVVSGVYRAARQATEVFSTVGSGVNGKFSSVVLVEFPGNGLRSIGLVTGRLKDQDGNPLLVVYMPTSPFPTSGFLVILPEDRVTPTDMAVDDAVKLIVSAGVMAPDRIVSYPTAVDGAPSQPVPPFASPPPDQGDPLASPDNRASNQ